MVEFKKVLGASCLGLLCLGPTITLFSENQYPDCKVPIKTYGEVSLKTECDSSEILSILHNPNSGVDLNLSGSLTFEASGAIAVHYPLTKSNSQPI